MSRQFDTWYGHALIAALLPALIAVWTPWGLGTAAIASTLTLAVFEWRERRDRRAHAGHMTEHMDSSHVTPIIDGHGDIIGPRTATLVYWLAWLL